jgi:hypothetical protein
LAFGFRVGEGEKTLWREKVIFRFIKNALGSVQDTLREGEREIFEESLERKVRSKLAHFPRDLGCKSQGVIFCFEVLLYYFVEIGHTVRIRIATNSST